MFSVKRNQQDVYRIYILYIPIFFVHYFWLYFDMFSIYFFAKTYVLAQRKLMILKPLIFVNISIQVQ